LQRNKIYKTAQWYKTREDVFKLDHYECQRCNHNVFETGEPKKITKATLVHHRYHVDQFPQYKYSIYVNGERNLVSLCFNCHEQLHGRKHGTKEGEFVTEERYD